ncbi:hypothetical protein FACS1894202_12760 [Clostridia bacterium]|nr:hypothetical protein FACS1894202_12760 [Clostridia bacterium]
MIITKRLLKSRRGSGYIDAVIVVMVFMLGLTLVVKTLPAYQMKRQLDLFATEICRTAEITGRIGVETNARIAEMREQTGLNPTIVWNPASGNVQLNGDISVVCTASINLSYFKFTTPAITLRAKATGKSEVYWK